MTEGRKTYNPKCPACKGTGKVWDTDDVYWPNEVADAPWCPQCDGTGTLEKLKNRPPTSIERAMGVD